MLKRGVGVHHSGLLPILKEVIEILFQENLIKACSPPASHRLPQPFPAKNQLLSSSCACMRQADSLQAVLLPQRCLPEGDFMHSKTFG